MISFVLKYWVADVARIQTCKSSAEPRNSADFDISRVTLEICPEKIILYIVGVGNRKNLSKNLTKHQHLETFLLSNLSENKSFRTYMAQISLIYFNKSNF